MSKYMTPEDATLAGNYTEFIEDDGYVSEWYSEECDFCGEQVYDNYCDECEEYID